MGENTTNQKASEFGFMPFKQASANAKSLEKIDSVMPALPDDLERTLRFDPAQQITRLSPKTHGTANYFLRSDGTSYVDPKTGHVMDFSGDQVVVVMKDGKRTYVENRVNSHFYRKDVA